MSYSKAVLGRLKWAAVLSAISTVGLVSASSALAAGPRLGSRVLEKGMEGPDVKTLQRDLTKAGIWTFVSGVYSEGTQIHVKYFQSDYRLEQTGIVGPSTVRELEKVVALDAKKERDPSSKRKEKVPRDDSGGAGFVPPPSDAPVEKAHINAQGLAVAPSDAPIVIQDVIAAANKIAHKPYVYGGGHQSFYSRGYDCSGSVSYALHGGSLLASPLDSSGFASYGDTGAGSWITIWTDPGYHTYMRVAGLWFDTAAQSAANGDDRWSKTRISTPSGFMERHPAGW